jgi:hypothetical protein
MRLLIIISVFAILSLTGAAWAHPSTGRTSVSEHKTFDTSSYRKHVASYLKYTRVASKTDRGHATEVPFESLRMLSTGMTRSEVLSRVGPPRHMLRKSRVWVYSGIDHWIVELTFGGDRVIGVNWSRP